MTTLSTRPERPVVGTAVPHESAELHVTGLALYTDDLVNRHPGVLHAHPVQAPHTHARVTALRTAPMEIAIQYLKEPTVISARSVGIAAKAPHPNAARLFVNWLLS